MDEMDVYLKSLINNCTQYITFSGDKPANLNRWLIKSELADKHSIASLNPYISKDERILSGDEINTLPKDEAEANWRFFDAGITFGSNTPEREIFTGRVDRYIYCLCNVYCQKQQDILMYINTPIPIRMWINGQLAFTSSHYYHQKPYTIAAKFNEGENSVLVEKLAFLKSNPTAMDVRYFSVSLKPLDYLLDKRLKHEVFFDRRVFEYMDKSYNIAPDRAFYLPQHETGLVVLPKYITSSQEDKIKVSVLNSAGQEVQSIFTTTSRQIVLDIAKEINGVLYIKAEGVDNQRFGEAFVFRGNFEEYRDLMMHRVQQRLDCNESIIDIIKGITEIPEVDTGVIKGTTEVINGMLYGYILENLFEIEKYIYSPDSSSNKKMPTDIFKRRFMAFKKSEIDGEATAYTIHLPEGYKPNKKYPVVIYLMYGYGSSKYPANMGFILNRQFQDAILVGMCGRGDLRGEYIDEINTINIISDIVENLNIGKDKVYLVGTCAGVVRGFALAAIMPGAFTAVANTSGGYILGEADREFLKNVDNTVIYHLVNIENLAWNVSATMHVSKWINKAKTWGYYNFTHEEFDEIFNTGKLVKHLIREKKDKFPVQVQYTTYEPIYNKSYWVKIDRMDCIGAKAIIKANIQGKELITIDTENIKAFSMLVDKNSMGLNNNIETRVNNINLKFDIPKYSLVSIIIEGNKATGQVSKLTREEFNALYNRIRIDEALMGIKQIYLKKCTVVIHDAADQDEKALTDKLLAMLKQPLKERIRNYRYSATYESSLKPELLSMGNFIYVIDSRNVSELQQQVLNEAGVKAGAVALNYDGKEFYGDYFAVLKRKNPFNSQCNALIIAYNNNAFLEELHKLFSDFGMNPKLYNDEIIFNNGEYKYLSNPG
ncbi:MAG: hypothetical protein N3B21_15665 [Clostridia bacterium]|nr:hypothetical protein [Clostridia bacterium]